MLDFPSSPTDGQIYGSYLYSGGVWMQNGALLTPTAQTRNRIVNPAMQVSQENGNAVGSTNSYYPADQWLAVFGTTGTLFIQRVQVVTSNGSKDRFRIAVNTADTSLAAGELLVMQQSIEGNRMADFRYGLASAKQSILRFGFKAPAGTYSIALNNAAANRSYVANFTITAGQANTDTEQVFVIPGDITGTWPTDTSKALDLRVTIASGSTTIGVAGWQAGNFIATSSNTNGLATAGNTFELFDVGLYLDPQATGAAPPWQMPDEAQELRACQRYYLKSANQIIDTSALMQSFTLPAPMRVSPTITGGGPGFAVYSGDPTGAGTMAVYQTTRNTLTLTYSARM
jgi:hypothetical protein